MPTCETVVQSVVRRERPEGSTAVPVFVFHPAGGSTVAYEPLLRRLPAGTPMYGFERTEGSIEVRAAEYLPLIKEIQGDGPYVLYGWSLGGHATLRPATGVSDYQVPATDRQPRPNSSPSSDVNLIEEHANEVCDQLVRRRCSGRPAPSLRSGGRR